MKWQIQVFILFVITIVLISCGKEKDSLFFVFLNTNTHRAEISAEQIRTLQKGHMENIERLHKEGKLLAAGPFQDKGGIFILKMPSLSEAKALLRSDPAIAAGRFLLEVYPLYIDHGAVLPVGEKYHMASYQAFRFFTTGYKMGYDQSLKIHQEFLKNLPQPDSLIFAANFGRGENFWLLYQQKNDSLSGSIFLQHPLVKDSLWQFTQRKLWIARETFIADKGE